MGDEGCCYRIRKCASCLVSLLIMGVLAVLLWNFLGRPSKDEVIEGIGNFDFGDFSNVLGNMTDDIWTNTLTGNEDPFVGDNTTEAWATNGRDGLSLELQNALDDAWQAEFQEAVADWEESEVLSLTTQRVAVDHTCGRVEGVMLVCNGNFGDTGWVGINEIEITSQSRNGPGFITSSVAKMNEYYLNNANYAKRLYTMCHEIGHGFGLPHTDENPRNRDLGNCLDYTNTPENNLRPGEVNFARLRQIYLENPNANNEEGSNVNQLQQDGNVEVEEIEEVEQQGGAGNPRNNLRRIVVRHYLYVDDFYERN